MRVDLDHSKRLLKRSGPAKKYQIKINLSNCNKLDKLYTKSLRTHNHKLAFDAKA